MSLYNFSNSTCPGCEKGYWQEISNQDWQIVLLPNSVTHNIAIQESFKIIHNGAYFNTNQIFFKMLPQVDDCCLRQFLKSYMEVVPSFGGK